MKNIMLIVFFLFGWCNSLIAQYQVDMINIYSIPFSKSYVSEQYTSANNVRVNYDFCITIKERYLISDILKEYNSIKKEKIVEKNKNENWGCRIVIDFVKNARITKSVVFHVGNVMSFDEPYHLSILYKTDKDFMCFLNNHFPSIINANQENVNCTSD